LPLQIIAIAMFFKHPFIKRSPVFIIFLVVISMCHYEIADGQIFSRKKSDKKAEKTNPQELVIKREQAYHANNVGVALLEQFKYKEASDSFRKAITIYPQLHIARLNLGIALFNIPDVENARKELEAIVDEMSNSPHAYYMLGLIARTQNRIDDAILAFKRVLKLDPDDVGANVNLGQIYLQERKYADAIAVFRKALNTEPYNATAAYNLSTALMRAGQREEGMQMMQQFQTLREAGYGSTIGQNYLEQGRYAEAVSSTGMEPELVDPSVPAVQFIDVTKSVLKLIQPRKPLENSRFSIFGHSFKASEITDSIRHWIAGQVSSPITLIDFDGDGDQDIFEIHSSTQHLFRNDKGTFVEVTSESGLGNVPSSSTSVCAVAGDYNNDNKLDLFVLRYGISSLYQNEGSGKFSDVTVKSNIPAYPHLAVSVAFIDVDHDNDLDLFIAGFANLKNLGGGTDPNRLLTFPQDFSAAPNMLLRNNGDGKFVDVSAVANVAVPGGHTISIIPTDYNNRRDIDILLVNYGSPLTLFSNLRNGSFKNVAGDVGLGIKDKFTSATAADINKDGYTDFFLCRDDASGLWAISNGNGQFRTSQTYYQLRSSLGQFLDYDNDGLIDLLSVGKDNRLDISRNIGVRWANVTSHALTKDLRTDTSRVRSISLFDMELDGDIDVILNTASESFKIMRNDGGNRNPSLRISLAGKVSNRGGVGAKIEMRAGSLRQRLEIYATSPAISPETLLFGLGKREKLDAVRVSWPSGTVQSETDIFNTLSPKSKSIELITITELDRKPSSCPYLFAWDGQKFQFITDFMGGGEMGYWLAPGVWNKPDPDEYVRIRGDQLKEREGRYELRITNELEEVLYIDRLQLIAISHPSDLDIFPNEGLVAPPYQPLKIFKVRNARPPDKALDNNGKDVTSLITAVDRKYPDEFKLLNIRGYAEDHSLILDVGEGNDLLMLTGWTDYAFSSDNVAAHQRGLSMKPPSLQMKNDKGEWKTVIENIGIPVGRPQTIALDLKDKFLSSNREVRIQTNMRIYWDQVLVGNSVGSASIQTNYLEASVADLKWRGFSAELSPDGKEPFSYDYNRISIMSPWKVIPGFYTREGDVRELINKVDDMFVISQPGDELRLSFDATSLPPLQTGWTRTFLLYADGFSKEMDINSASPDQVAPLPFHNMKDYPYKAPASYPTTSEHEKYLKTYNTREVRSPLPSIELVDIQKVRY
jgi:Tfp pilus assembly protein PilF